MLLNWFLLNLFNFFYLWFFNWLRLNLLYFIYIWLLLGFSNDLFWTLLSTLLLFVLLVRGYICRLITGYASFRLGNLALIMECHWLRLIDKGTLTTFLVLLASFEDSYVFCRLLHFKRRSLCLTWVTAHQGSESHSLQAYGWQVLTGFVMHSGFSFRDNIVRLFVPFSHPLDPDSKDGDNEKHDQGDQKVH